MNSFKVALSLLPLLLAACSAAPETEHEAEQSSAIVPRPPPCVIIGGELKCFPFDGGIVTPPPPPPVCDPPCTRPFDRCVLADNVPVCRPLTPLPPDPLR